MQSLRTALSSSILFALLAFAGGPAAAAGQPERVFLPADDLAFAAGELCDFAVAQDVLVNEEYGLFFPIADDGSQLALVSGRLTLRITNLETGTSIDVNASGPGKLTFNADGSTDVRAMGRWTLFFLAGDADGPSYRLTTGLGIIHVDATGTETLAIYPQHSPDLCAALAA